MEPSRWALRAEALFLLLALLSLLAARREIKLISPALWYISAIAGLAYASMRYWMTFPMTPSFSGSILYPPLMVMFGALSTRGSEKSTAAIVHGWLMICGLAVTLIGLCFPKDFYLPIIKTTSVYAHGVLIFGSLGRACFFVAAGWGCAALFGATDVMQRMFRWLVFGFACWTLSLFSGEVWSYSGWGVPMVWEDASTLTAIGTWLFFVGVMHQHLSGQWTRKLRAAMSVLGALLILVLNGGPDMGPFRSPFSIF